MDVAGYPMSIHPPTASRPYHQIAYRVGGERRVTRQVDGVPTPGAPKGRKVPTTVCPPTTPGGIKLSALVSRRARAAGEGLMFPAPRGGVWGATNFYNRRFHPAADVAGWPRGEDGRRLWTWHDLRHVFASH